MQLRTLKLSGPFVVMELWSEPVSK